jgi:hypothetical protein
MRRQTRMVEAEARARAFPMVHVAMPHILKVLLLSRCCVGMGQGTFGL